MRRFRAVAVRPLLPAMIVLAAWPPGAVKGADEPDSETRVQSSPYGLVRCSSGGAHFVVGKESRPLTLWGVNYDHDESGRLIEDYWHEEWDVVESDLAEIRALHANVVRIHLQLGRFMRTPQEPDSKNLQRLQQLIKVAERERIYLNLTGLGCYHKQDVPEWYDELEEQQRWDVQARFWTAVAEVGRDSPAVFCYDLMNEPILPGREPSREWLAGELGGKHFVQRLSLDLAGRSRSDVAAAWVSQMTQAIRSVDHQHMITVGVIPWALSFPGAKPLFYSEEVGRDLDFVSVHFYPRAGEVDKALEAFRVYDVGKPIVVEEMFPLKCSIPELQQWIDGTADVCDGWISFYWGRTIAEYNDEGSLRSAIVAQWLKHFRDHSPLAP